MAAVLTATDRRRGGMLHDQVARQRCRLTRRQRIALHTAVVLIGLQPTLAGAVSCGATVPGTLTLTADLACPDGHGLLLGAGASLDCAGHSISGASKAGQYGIYLRDVSDATVRNCTVLHFEVGIRLRGAVDCAVYDSVAHDNARYGVEVTQSSVRALIWRNEVYTNGDEGIHVSGPGDVDGDHQLLENTFDGNGREGIYLLGSHGNIIAGNTVQNHGAAGIYVKNSRRNSIVDNLLTNDPIQLVAGSELNVLGSNAIIGQRMKFDEASRNHVYGSTVQEWGGRPSNAFEFVNSSDNRIVDAEALNPVDYHVKTVGASAGNVFTRFLAVPELLCSIDTGSSVTVTDPDGSPLPCGAIGGTSTTTATLPSTTTTATPTSTTTVLTWSPPITTTSTTTTTQPPRRTVVETRVRASSDDAEEQVSGSAKLTSSDLELVYDKRDQTVGMRFTGLVIPAGAGIVEAFVQFQVDERSTEATTLVVQGEDTDDAAPFAGSYENISSRTRTAASVQWSPPPWTSVGEAGPGQRTPNIAAIVQEIIDRPGWRAGNGLVIIITGRGERVAESYDGDRDAAPLLHVEY